MMRRKNDEAYIRVSRLTLDNLTTFWWKCIWKCLDAKLVSGFKNKLSINAHMQYVYIGCKHDKVDNSQSLDRF